MANYEFYGVAVNKYELISKAILEKKNIVAIYNNLEREFCPYALGLSKKNQKEGVVAFQFGGESNKGFSDGRWRNFFLEKLEGVKILDGSNVWVPADEAYDPYSFLGVIDVEA